MSINDTYGDERDIDEVRLDEFNASIKEAAAFMKRIGKRRPTVAELQEMLDKLDDGVLMCGAHEAGKREFCVLEFDNTLRSENREYLSDEPNQLPDLRGLNDAFGEVEQEDRANERRTTALLAVMSELWDWNAWEEDRQNQFYTNLAKRVSRVSGEPLRSIYPGDDCWYDFVEDALIDVDYEKKPARLAWLCKAIIEESKKLRSKKPSVRGKKK